MSLIALVLSLNCGRAVPDAKLLASHVTGILSRNGGAPDLIFLSIQEIAPISYAFIGGDTVSYYFEAYRKAIGYIGADQDKQYVEIINPVSGMTAGLLFAKVGIAERLYDVSTAAVGVGVAQMGNKGAVGVRVAYVPVGSSRKNAVHLTFIAAHLAPHEFNLERRNEDWKNIVQKLVFIPSGTSPTTRPEEVDEEEEEEEEELMLTGFEASGIYVPQTHIIVAGDLNYRTSSRSPTAEDQLLYPRPVSNTNSKVHFSKLLQNDQLKTELDAGRTFQGFTEAKIDFPPTYKYAMSGRRSDGTGLAESTAKIQHAPTQDPSENTEEWNWAPWRWPSWCDRILFTPTPSWQTGTAKVEAKYYNSLPILPTTDHRAVVLLLSIPTTPIPAPSAAIRTSSTDPRLHPPYGIEPQWRLNRSAARNMEFVVGVGMWLSTTSAGRMALVAIVLSAWYGISLMQQTQ